MRLRFATAALVAALAAAAPAAAYVPPAPKMVEAWADAYRKADQLVLSGTMAQGAAAAPFRVRIAGGAVAYEESGRPVSDVTSTLAFTILLRPQAAASWLKGLGMDVTQTGLARDNGAVVWTLGAAGERQPGTQVWLDRDAKTPLRVRIVRPTLTQTIEFLDYEQSPSRLVPRVIRVTVDGVVRTYTIEKVATGK